MWAAGVCDKLLAGPEMVPGGLQVVGEPFAVRGGRRHAPTVTPTACEGTAEVVYDGEADADVPARIAIAHPDDTANGRYSEVMGCYHCEDGSVVMPSLYQPFKRDVIANLPESGWALTRTEVLEWIRQHPPTQK